MIELLVMLAILLLVGWAISQIPLDPPIRVLIVVAVVVICLVWLARNFGGAGLL